MKIFVYPHDLGMGGSQLNAIELAGAVRDLGHEVVLYGRPGVLNARIAELGLGFIEGPVPSVRPTPRIVADLRRHVKSGGFDVVHGYEWPPIMEARLAVAGSSAAAVGTVMSMAVAPFIPRDLPLVVGTEQIAATERAVGRRNVSVIEPPVDTVANSPDIHLDTDGFRRNLSISPDSFLLVCVTRLAHELKLEGLLAAMTVVGQLGSQVTLVIVGDGPAAPEVRAAAAAVNSESGRCAVLLTGQLDDPRVAYASADAVIGMGGSALRALAFAKPLVVQGEHGFWRTLSRETLRTFHWTGWYGVGDGAETGAEALRRELDPIMSNVHLRDVLGQFGRQTVARHFSLRAAADRQLEVYERAFASSPHGLGARRHDVAATVRLFGYTGGQMALNRLGRAPADDFNAVPVSAPTLRGPLSDLRTPLVVHVAGVSWDGAQGTDHRLAAHLTKDFPVLWVDPVRPSRQDAGVGQSGELGVTGLTQVGARVWRLAVFGPRGTTRPILRDIARIRLQRRIRQAQLALAPRHTVALGSSPLFRLASIDADRRIFLATDDFEAGAGLMGLSTGVLRHLWRANARDADMVLAVSPVLVEQLRSENVNVRLFPNGCSPEMFGAGAASPAPEVVLPHPIAGVVGQLNERIDTALLLGLARAGVSLLMVGPMVVRDNHTAAAFEALLGHSNVQWVGGQPYERVPSFSAAMDVGLTPYRDSAFNRASFPLKTLEYLSAGLPVVSTDLPSARWLSTDLVYIADDENYVATVRKVLEDPNRIGTPEQRRTFASAHSWEARANELAGFIGRSALTPEFAALEA